MVAADTAAKPGDFRSLHVRSRGKTSLRVDRVCKRVLPCNCNYKNNYNTNISIGQPGFKSYMHSYQQMMWVNSALQVCWVSALCHHLNSNDLVHIYREAAAGDQNHAAYHRATGGRAVRHKYPVCFEYFEVGECPRSFFPKGPGLAQAR